MFGRNIKLFKLLGFEVGLDPSWLVLAILVAWSLSTGFFPFQHEGLSTQTYWIMGIVGALGLFLSIIIHEFSHSVVARAFGISMKGITLFIFGGVARMESEPPSAKSEFFMAVVGPVASFLLAFIFYLISMLGEPIFLPTPVLGVVEYLAIINTLLGVFNLIPAFPLDGGRILRSILWKIKGNLRWATRFSASVGRGFGFALIIVGLWRILSGQIVGGMWLGLIGMFLQSAAKMSYQQLLTRRALDGEPVSRFMKADPVTVPPGLTVDQFIEDYVYRHFYKMYPVTENGKILGCVTTQEAKKLDREKWSDTRIDQLDLECGIDAAVRPDDDAMKAISIMKQHNMSRLLVVDQEGRLKGVVALKDLLEFLSLKVELDEPG